jgi:hypothetical protein
VKSRTLLLLSGIATLLFIVIMLLHGAPLKVEGVSPRGIIDLELAGTVAHATTIYNAWYPDLTSLATKNTIIDFFFLVSYGTFLAVSCYSISRYYNKPIKTIGWWLTRLMIVAAFFDAIENVLMLTTLAAHFKKEIVATTFMFASIKFLLVAAGIVYIAFAGLALLVFPRKKIGSLRDAGNF